MSLNIKGTVGSLRCTMSLGYPSWWQPFLLFLLPRNTPPLERIPDARPSFLFKCTPLRSERDVSRKFRRMIHDSPLRPRRGQVEDRQCCSLLVTNAIRRDTSRYVEIRRVNVATLFPLFVCRRLKLTERKKSSLGSDLYVGR